MIHVTSIERCIYFHHKSYLIIKALTSVNLAMCRITIIFGCSLAFVARLFTHVEYDVENILQRSCFRNGNSELKNAKCLVARGALHGNKKIINHTLFPSTLINKLD